MLKKESKQTTNNRPDSRPVQGAGFDYLNIPWSLNISYDVGYDKPYYKSEISQTMRVSGKVDFTKKWAMNFSTGWDFERKKVSMTNISITRDLHCWQASFSCVPFGQYQFYEFRINAKAAILQDLKYEKRNNWQDNDVLR